MKKKTDENIMLIKVFLCQAGHSLSKVIYTSTQYHDERKIPFFVQSISHYRVFQICIFLLKSQFFLKLLPAANRVAGR